MKERNEERKKEKSKKRKNSLVLGQNHRNSDTKFSYKLAPNICQKRLESCRKKGFFSYQKSPVIYKMSPVF